MNDSFLKMTKEQLKKEASRLLSCKNLDDCYELISIYQKFIFIIIRDYQQDKVNSKPYADAEIILQMVFTKVCYLEKVFHGIDYKYENRFLNRFIDPTIFALLLRNIYETVALFNLIYINTKSEDELIIIYNLWVHSGLKYRQKFKNNMKANENKNKLEKEKEQIEGLIKEIKETNLYKSLNKKNQDKIKTKLKTKDYRISFSGKEVEFLNWQDMTKTLGLKINSLDNIYNYFSLYTHPTNVSVFQFSEMFKEQGYALHNLNIVNFKNAVILISIFIADYINLFPKIKISFEKLDIREQIAINYQNIFAREEKHSINDCLADLK